MLLNSIYLLKWKLGRVSTYLENSTIDGEGPDKGRHTHSTVLCICVHFFIQYVRIYSSGPSLSVALFLSFHLTCISLGRQCIALWVTNSLAHVASEISHPLVLHSALGSETGQ